MESAAPLTAVSPSSVAARDTVCASGTTPAPDALARRMIFAASAGSDSMTETNACQSGSSESAIVSSLVATAGSVGRSCNRESALSSVNCAVSTIVMARLRFLKWPETGP